MLLSIVVPVYNVEKYIKECLNSICDFANANENDIEIILINDGSKDLSGAICDDYASKFNCIKLIHQENKGLSVTRNVGIKAAKGKYIQFLDSDDYLETSRLPEFFSFLKNQDADIVFINGIDNNGTTKIFSKYNLETSFVEKGIEDFLSCAYTNFIIGAAAQIHVINKEFLKDNSLFFCENILHEDNEWMPRVLTQAKNISLFSTPIYNYRVGRVGSILTSGNVKKRCTDLLLTANSLIDFQKRFINDNIRFSFLQINIGNCMTTSLKLAVSTNDKKLQVLLKEQIKKIENYKLYLKSASKTSKICFSLCDIIMATKLELLIEKFKN